ncbi:type VII toxin-antitoxin system HepT family RNase toxin [Rheinheimera sp.]|uniref:type VII toxin-antitoxin system HepT family RNase toxin n=1 Tax=Rheinheimera sp. TaxID=1869214 RepID=UPI002FDEEC58
MAVDQSPLPDDVLINKAATIERCVNRAREEYDKDPATFATDFTRQDAAILNIQRACEAALDMGQHLIRKHKLGVPQSSRDVFTLLATGGFIPAELADNLKKMVGFRNIAVHEYQRLQVPVAEMVIQHRLQDFQLFCGTLIKNT